MTMRRLKRFDPLWACIAFLYLIAVGAGWLAILNESLLHL